MIMNLLFTMAITKYVKQEQQRKVGAVKKASGIQDTLTMNEALKDNGNDAKKVCENFGCVVREHKCDRLNYELRSQSIEAHEEKYAGYPEKADRIIGAGNNSSNGICNTKSAIMREIQWNMTQCRVTEEPLIKYDHCRTLELLF
ncbi:hypothetical protein B9Z55_028765 [Caenorhabditis nigoni]|uniref:Uncharacterized protein n=1 Tax=Caenorhabditis nigoni TaxID=1611254 RepID=A0A2G5SAH2_9PELO|nr:hypothetical protein B9Z55_028765 [Caenorhabditis nigoni]